MRLNFTIDGPPRTKKNHGRVIKRGARKFHIPSEALEKWNNSAQLQLAKLRAKTFALIPVKIPVNCRAIFYRHANVGDLLGFEQALADALQQGGIVENDRLITQWDGSRMLVDKVEPRVDVELTEARA